MSYDDAATLSEFWVIAKQFDRSLYPEWRDHWDERGYNEYIVVTEDRLPYCESPELYVCHMETRYVNHQSKALLPQEQISGSDGQGSGRTGRRTAHGTLAGQQTEFLPCLFHGLRPCH